ncbi:MAG: HAD hydrolase family protein, partial [Oscillospiraceae bacterium]|nr:HAD hydrolase family protein [Oscillospiraceae bacterium]
RMIQNRFSILPEESMAFGDLMNDYEMLKECEYSFAMENACEGIYKVARYTTASNDEDGVMKILRNIEQYG